VSALVRMRLVRYLRTGRFLAPFIASLVVLGGFYGGGQAPAGEAYGVSALLLFPILAWQAKLLLDAEPDVQRRLAAVAVGSAVREQVAGLLAAVVAALPLVGLALVQPWGLAGIQVHPRPEDPTLASAVLVGLWAHLIIVAPAVVLGALASRAVTRSFGLGAVVLITGAVLSLVLGLGGSPAWWLVPPTLSVTRLAVHGFVPGPVATVSLHALLWVACAGAGYSRLRRLRA
jgi:hypothetical protein